MHLAVRPDLDQRSGAPAELNNPATSDDWRDDNRLQLLAPRAAAEPGRQGTQTEGTMGHRHAARGAAGTGARSTATRRKGPVGTAKPALLAGGNPQIAKADGDAPVRAYIAAMPGWKRDVGHRLDALVVRTVPGVRKAVRWNSPFYGIEGRGWFLSFHTFTNYVKVTFFQGTSLRPVPPGGKAKEARWIDVHEADLDEAQLATWVRQASALPGWGKV